MPEVWRDITPVVEEALPKDAPLFEELPKEIDCEVWLLVLDDVEDVEEVTMAVLTGKETICPLLLKEKVCS